MSGERYADKAVKSLLDFIESNLQTYLTEVETDQSLSTGTMVAPTDYVPAWIPPDHRTPLLMVYCDNGDVIDYSSKIHQYDCSVVLSYAGDADIEAGQLMMRRYLTALIQTIASDRTLNSAVVEAVETDQSLFAETDSSAQQRYAIALGVEVTVQEG